MQRKASAQWLGSLKTGRGTLTTDSQALVNTSYSFSTRFENEKGTNPEELIAAAHAGCFSMALSGELEKMQLSPESIQTQARVNLDKSNDGWTVNAIHLDVTARVPGATQTQFLQAAQAAKTGCPISRLLKANISMDAKLEMAEATSPQEMNY